MSRLSKRLPMVAVALLYFAAVPLALSSDRPQGDESDPNSVPTAEAEKAPLANEPDTSKATGDQPATAAVAESGGPAIVADEWVCRKETPTGSHRSIKTCRRAADIEASSAEVEQVMNRQKHYGNPSVTPQN